MSTIRTQWKNLLQKDMTRKEFLGLVGFAALVICNIEPMLRLFGKDLRHPASSDARGQTYGKANKLRKL